MTPNRARGLIVAAALAALTTGCQRSEPDAEKPAMAPADAWASIRDHFIEDRLASNPPFAVDSGRHEFDGKLPDWSKAGIAANIARLHETRDSVAKFDTSMRPSHSSVTT